MGFMGVLSGAGSVWFYVDEVLDEFVEDGGDMQDVDRIWIFPTGRAWALAISDTDTAAHSLPGWQQPSALRVQASIGSPFAMLMFCRTSLWPPQ